NLTGARQAHTATLLPSTLVKNGQVLVAGGSNGTASQSTAELWNGTATWTATTALPAARQGQTATLLGNNMVLLAGGANGTTGLATATLYDASFALGCTSNSQCTTGFCVNGVCCDTACNSGCGACNLTGKLGICSAVASGTVCRAALGACDAAETCSGSSLSCPTGRTAGAGTVCAAASGNQGAETCSGVSLVCPESARAADVLGFETAGDWTASTSAAQILVQSANHSQWLQSLAVSAHGTATFTSISVSAIGSGGNL